MPTDKQGNKLTWREFLKRWKRGIDGVTAMQQVNMQLQSSFIILFGMLLGIIVSAANYEKFWWVIIVLIGGVFNLGISITGLFQKKHQMQYFEDLQFFTNQAIEYEKEVEQNV